MKNDRLLTQAFYFDGKNTQRHQFDYQHSIKNFYRLYKMRWNILRLCLTLSIAIFQRFLHNKTLSLLIVTTKKAKKFKDSKKTVVFQEIALT